MTYADVDALLVDELDAATRDATPASRMSSFNAAYRDVIRLLIDLRADFFVFETGDFVVPANAIRVGLDDDAFDGIDILRIRSIRSLGPDAGIQVNGSVGYGAGAYSDGAYGGGSGTPTNTRSTTQRRWEPRDLASPDFAAAERAQAQDASVVFFDLIRPGGTATLAIAPPLATDDTPLISVTFQPPRITATTDPIVPLLVPHVELLIDGAMERLLTPVDDAAADRYGVRFKEGRSRLIQHFGRKQEQQANTIGSRMWDMGTS